MSESAHHIEEVFVIEDLETVKVVADPLRLRIIEALGDEPRTVKQIARILDIPPSKLYYHVNLLENHGLIRVVDTRVVSGIIEKLYLVRAHNLTVDRRLFTASQEGNDSVDLMLESIFQRARDDMLRSINAGLITSSPDDPPDKRQMTLGSMTLDLPEDRARAFQRELNDLLERYFKEENQAATDPTACRPFRLLLLFFPMVEPPPPDEE